MLYRITNKGEARTVTFLAVFAEGETKEFGQDEINNYQAMNGVKLASALDPEEFELEYISAEEG
jgi:hypothetical protein